MIEWRGFLWPLDVVWFCRFRGMCPDGPVFAGNVGRRVTQSTEPLRPPKGPQTGQDVQGETPIKIIPVMQRAF